MSKVFKGTWLHALPKEKDEIKRVVERLNQGGFDLLIPCVKQVSGIADYPSRVANVREGYRDFDHLAAVAEAAASTPLAIHAWSCVFTEGKDSALLAAHPEFEAITGPEKKQGEGHRLACPNRPEVQDYEAAIYDELLAYPIAGVSLDYIRFADGLCFCEYCRQDYAEKVGGDLHQLGFFGWDTAPAQDMDAWINWRCAVITRFVRRMRAAADQAQKELSASVFFYYPGGLVDIGQDWEKWTREGLVDYIWPMNYSRSTQVAAKWTRNNIATLAGSKSGCRHHEGIHRPRSMSTARFMKHVEGVLATGVEGIVIFDYPNLTDEDLAALAEL